MANKKTWSERILNAASKESIINTRTLRMRLRIPKTEMDSTDFNNSVMRSTRFLYAEGMLKRVDRGVYKISKKGKKYISAI